MQNYEELLEKAYEKFPKIKESEERLVIPLAEVSYQGNQTIIKNFSQIAQVLRRDTNHLMKFLTKELAAPGSSNDKATFQAKLPQKIIQQKIEVYVRDYVVCKECKRPDTKLIKEDRLTFLVCEACGAKISVKSIK
jgi:translation initiation factor 2 subunit 2